MTYDNDVVFIEVQLFIYVFVFLTQQSHETLMSLYSDMETGRYVPNSSGSSRDTRKAEEKELIDLLLDHFAKNGQAYPKTKAR